MDKKYTKGHRGVGHYQQRRSGRRQEWEERGGGSSAVIWPSIQRGEGGGEKRKKPAKIGGCSCGSLDRAIVIRIPFSQNYCVSG